MVATITVCIMTSCDKTDDSDNPYPPISEFDLIGVWDSNDDYFKTDRLYFRNGGTGQYEYGNNTSSGNNVINFTWSFYNSRVTINPERYITDLDGGALYRDLTGAIKLDYLGAIYSKISSDPSNAGNTTGGSGTGGGNSGTVTKDLLCRNGGAWLRSSTYSYELTYTQYCKSSDQFDFTENGTVTVYSYWECRGKNYYGIEETKTSEVLAVGSYRLEGNVLKCEFTNVTCSGSSDIVTQHWIQGVTNYKNYEADFDTRDATLLLTNADETYYLSQTQNQVPGGGGSSSYEAPDISYYDMTPGTNSIKVSYKIWNKDKCGTLSDARIYYGTSSASTSVVATVSGTYITANITGLSKGTKYKVKCSVASPGGNTTTEETTISTLN